MRISGEVVAAATSVASIEERSVAEQVNQWARIGMQIERSGTLGTRRVLAVANGTGQFGALTTDEREAAHALVDAAIARRVALERFGAAARADGRRTVSVDDSGQLVEISPDGSHRRL